MIFSKIISNKFVLILLVLLIIFLGKIKYKQYSEISKIEKEKKVLLEQAKILENKNQELSDSLKYLSSLNSKEKIARDQLNLKKPGETVYGFTENSNLNQKTTSNIENTKNSNIKKWQQYFFGNR